MTMHRSLQYRKQILIAIGIMVGFLDPMTVAKSSQLVTVEALMPPEKQAELQAEKKAGKQSICLQGTVEPEEKKPFGFLFAHGLGGSAQQVVYYTQQLGDWHIIPMNTKTFNFPELLPNGAIDASKINFAQKADLDALDTAYKAVSDESDRIVLVGVSRGGSVVLKYAARRPSNLAAVIAEAPFDSMPNLIGDYGLSKVLKSIGAIINQKRSASAENDQPRTYRFLDLSVGSVPGLTSAVHNAFAWYYPAYDKKGSQPIDQIVTVDRKVPILFIHSVQDTIVPISCTYRLCKQLRLLGHDHVYLLKLSVGEHAMYSYSESGWKYQATVHAFYKKYNLPYDEELAAQGNHFLQQAQQTYYSLRIYEDESWDIEL